MTGRTTIGLFPNSTQSLDRRLAAHEGEAGIRQHYKMGGWSVSPGAFFVYQRMEQRDRLTTSLTTDPRAYSLSSDVNSNHYRVGASVRLAHPVFTSNLIWSGNFAGGVDFVRARYNGAQTFGASSLFNTPFEQFASASDSRNRVGAFAGVETGITYWLYPGVSVSLMGNVRYISAMPYVRYPTAIDGTRTSSGSATLGFQSQVNYGGTFNFSIRM